MIEAEVLDKTVAVPLVTVEMLQQAVAHLQSVQPKFAPLVEAHGLPEKMLAKSEACFAALAKSIVYQQLAGKAAETILRRVLTVCGCDHVNKLTAAAIMRASAVDLRGAGLSERKLAYLTGLAAQFEGGHLSDDGIRGMSDADMMTRLTALNGIGPWTVNMFAMFHLGHPDVLPVGDLAIRKGVQAMYNTSKVPTPSEMEDLTNAWRPYRSVGCFYLWRMPESSARSPAGKKLPSPNKKSPAPKARTGAAAAATAAGAEEDAAGATPATDPPKKSRKPRKVLATEAHAVIQGQQDGEAADPGCSVAADGTRDEGGAAAAPSHPATRKPRRVTASKQAATTASDAAAEEANAAASGALLSRRPRRTAAVKTGGTAEEGEAAPSTPTKRRRKAVA